MMKAGRIGVLAVAVAMLAACNGRREGRAITGSYGQSLLAGEVVMSGGPRGDTPAGVQVSMRGTGMSMILAQDGRFAFHDAPDGVQLDFRRASDGIEASLHVQTSDTLVVELSRTAATATTKKSSKRRGVGPARDIYEFEGVIRSASATSIVLFTSKKVEQEIALAPDTIIRKGNRTLTAADLVAGTRVHVKARKSGDAYTAVTVLVQQTEEGEGEDDAPALREYEGTVRRAGPTELVVFTSHKVEVAFTLTPDTIIRKGNTPVAAADIQPGWRVHVKATLTAGGAATAVQVTIQNSIAEDVRIEGTVSSVASSSLGVTTAAGEVTVRTSVSTQVRKNGKKVSLSQVVAGDRVVVEGTRVNATTVEAKKITVWP